MARGIISDEANGRYDIIDDGSEGDDRGDYCDLEIEKCEADIHELCRTINRLRADLADAKRDLDYSVEQLAKLKGGG